MYGWEDDDNAKTTWASIPTTLIPLGGLISALLSSNLMTSGRRFVMYLAAILTFAGAIFMSILQHPSTSHRLSGLAFFCFGRLLMGLAVGLYSSVAPTFLNEIAPSHLSGLLGCCHQVFICFAIVIAAIIGLMLPNGSIDELQKSLGWRLAFAFPVVLVSLQVLLLKFVFTHDSPVFYMSKGKVKEAEEVYNKIYDDPEFVSHKIQEMQDAAKNSDSNSNSSDSLYANYKLSFWVGIILPALQQLTGINLVMFYAGVMFNAQNPDTANMMVFVTMLVNFLSTIGSLFLADRLGRKILLLWGSVGCAIGLLGCMIGATDKHSNAMNWIFNLSIFFFLIAFEFTHGPVCWLYMSEILPTVWMGYGVASSWVFTILVGLSVPYLFAGIGYWTYLLFVIFMVGTAVFCSAFIKETKGKNKDQILELFKSEKVEEPKQILNYYYPKGDLLSKFLTNN